MPEEVLDAAAQAEADIKEHEEANKRRLEAKKAAVEERRKKQKEMQIQLQDILFEFNGQESNIPINNGYWDLLNAFKAINKEDDTEFIRQQEAAQGASNA